MTSMSRPRKSNAAAQIRQVRKPSAVDSNAHLTGQCNKPSLIAAYLRVNARVPQGLFVAERRTLLFNVRVTRDQRRVQGFRGSRDTRSARRHRTGSAISCLGIKYRDRSIYVTAARGQTLLGQSLDSARLSVKRETYYDCNLILTASYTGRWVS